MHIIIRQGRLLFAISIIAFGALNLLFAGYGAAMAPVIPFVPGYPPAAYLIGLILLALGLAIAANVRARLAAILLGIVFLLCSIFLSAPRAAAHPLDVGIRTILFEPLSIGAAALALAGLLPAEIGRPGKWDNLVDKLIRSAPYLFAFSALVFGIDHFLVLDVIANLVPYWIPGAMFWAYLTGAGFIAAAVCIAAKRMARLAAILLGTMFGLWFLVLHAPRVLGLSFARVPGAPHKPAEWSSAFIALAMCGGSWIFAEAASAGKPPESTPASSA